MSESEKKHTSGPVQKVEVFRKVEKSQSWAVHPYGDEDLIVVINDDGDHVCLVNPVIATRVGDRVLRTADLVPESAERIRRDAPLIASAPALLAALEGVVRVADRETDEFIAARAAIALAHGGGGK